MSLLTTEAVKEYIENVHLGVPEVKEVILVEGGNANYTYRIRFAKSWDQAWGKHDSVILKHTSDHLRLYPDWKIDSIRQETEYEGLKLLATIIPEGYIAQAPKVIHYDPSHRVIIMQDLGELLTLKKRIIQNENSKEQSVEIGRGLANFISFVHSFTPSPEVLKTFQHPLGRKLATTGPSVIVERSKKLLNLTDSDIQIQILSTAAEQMTQDILTASKHLTLGDFWTGNILIDIKSQLQIYAVDFEMMKIGVPEYDVAQMVAEMFLAGCYYHPNENTQPMIDEFLSVWSSKQTGDEEQRKQSKKKIMAAFGKHLMMWYEHWSTPDVTIKAVQLGSEYVVAAHTDMKDPRNIFTKL